MPLNGATHLFSGDRRRSLDRPHIVARFERDFSPAIGVTHRVFDPSFVLAQINLAGATACRELCDALLTERLKARHRGLPPAAFHPCHEIMPQTYALRKGIAG